MKPWPPPGGLPPDEDPFASPPDSGPDLAAVLGASPEEDGSGRRAPFTLDAEWAAALSVIAHLLLFLLILVMPPIRRPVRPDGKVPDPLGLVKLFETPPPEPPIPVQFFPAPGPSAPRPGRNPLPSDADRVAHGGDVTQPRSETPRARAGQGIRDLAPGDRGERAAAPPQGQGGESPSAGEEARAAERTSPDGLRDPDSAGRLKGLRSLSSSPLTGLTAEQVARLAQSDGAGGEGGGGWERDGGFVDSGPLSFDTAEYDWGPYAAEMVRRIKLNWDVPTLAHYGVKGRVTIRFYIRRDGRVEGATILSSSGIPPFDNAAFQAILRSSPFRPLPADLGHDREGVTVTFFYNIRPEDAARK